jgi:hypothetical protein
VTCHFQPVTTVMVREEDCELPAGRGDSHSCHDTLDPWAAVSSSDRPRIAIAEEGIGYLLTADCLPEALMIQTGEDKHIAGAARPACGNFVGVMSLDYSFSILLVFDIAPWRRKSLRAGISQLDLAMPSIVLLFQFLTLHIFIKDLRPA